MRRYAAVPLEKTTSYGHEFPRKAGEGARVPDRAYRELNPAEPIPAGSTTHSQFPGHMPGFPVGGLYKLDAVDGAAGFRSPYLSLAKRALYHVSYCRPNHSLQAPGFSP